MPVTAPGSSTSHSDHNHTKQTQLLSLHINTHLQSTHLQSTHLQSPVYTSPVYTSPAFTSPVYTPPVYTSPVYTSPVCTSPVYTSPVYTSPVYTSPVYTSPVYTSPAYNLQYIMENESEQSGGGPLVAWETLMNPSHNQSPPKQNIIKRLTSKILQDIHPFYKAHSLTDLSNLNLTREEDVHEAIRRIWLLEKGKSANGDLEKFLVEQMSKLYPPTQQQPPQLKTTQTQPAGPTFPPSPQAPDLATLANLLKPFLQPTDLPTTGVSRVTPPSSFGTLNSLDRYHLKILKELKVNSRVTKNIVRVLTSFRDFYERDHPWLYTEECIIRSLSFVLGDEEELTSKLSMFIANKTSIKDIFKKLLLSYGREMSFLSRLNEFTKAVNDDVSSPSEVFDKISSLIYLPGLQLEESNRIGLNQARLYVNRIGGHILPSIIDQAMQFGKKTTFEDFYVCLRTPNYCMNPEKHISRSVADPLINKLIKSSQHRLVSTTTTSSSSIDATNAHAHITTHPSAGVQTEVYCSKQTNRSPLSLQPCHTMTCPATCTLDIKMATARIN